MNNNNELQSQITLGDAVFAWLSAGDPADSFILFHGKV